MFPLNGASVVGSRHSRVGRSSAMPSRVSMCARVVSKCAFDGTISPGSITAPKKIALGAAPLVRGHDEGEAEHLLTAAWKRSKLCEPA